MPARPHRRCGLLGLASGGVCLATPVTRSAGALLPHRFTLTTMAVAVCFLWHFPASHLGLLLAITLLCEVRTFLDSGAGPLELTEARLEPRPPSQLVRVRYGTRRAGFRRTDAESPQQCVLGGFCVCSAGHRGAGDGFRGLYRVGRVRWRQIDSTGAVVVGEPLGRLQRSADQGERHHPAPRFLHECAADGVHRRSIDDESER